MVHPDATFRSTAEIDNNDGRFALRVDDVDAALGHLFRHGYAEDSGRRLLDKRHGPAGIPQVYVLDPDGHVVELNARA